MNAPARTDRLPAVIAAVETRLPAFAKLLPPTISPQRFIAAAKTALLTVPGLAEADLQSTILALMRCASDGLVPDGRDAVIVVGNAKKNGQWVKQAQYWIMVGGLQKVIWRTGQVTRLEARLVYAGDDFALTYGSEPGVLHSPAFKNRGDIIGAYALATLKSGEVYVEWMDRDELEGIMRRSKGWDPDGNKAKGPWLTDFGEMARKTVLRRAAKYLPTEAAAATLENDEDAAIDDHATDDAELIEGRLSAPSETHEGRSTITSGKAERIAARPAEEPADVAEAEMAREEQKPSAAKSDDASRRNQTIAGEVITKAQDTTGVIRIAADDVKGWKAALRDLRTKLAGAMTAEQVEDVYNAWDIQFDAVPIEVTAEAKRRVDARLAENVKAATDYADDTGEEDNDDIPS